jgi:methyl-accepting chemotaxis protein
MLMLSFLNNIFSKILLSCFLIAVVPLTGFIYQIQLNESDQRQNVKQNLLQALDIAGGKVDNWADINLRNTRFLSNLEAFRSMKAEAQVPLLIAAKESLDWISLIFVKNLNGDAVARSDGKLLQNYSDREYFKQVMSGQKMGQQVLIGKLAPVPLHCFAIPINKSKVGEKRVGIITQCSTLLSISEYIKSSSFGQSGYTFLVDNKKRLIATGDNKFKLAQNLQDFSSHPALKLKDNDLQILSFEGKDRVFVKKTVGPDWTLVIQQDYTEAYANFLSSKSNGLLLIVFTILITLILSFIVSKNISSPIKKLTMIADSLSKGRLTGEVPGKFRKDEVGELSRAIVRMAKTIEVAIRRLRERNEE